MTPSKTLRKFLGDPFRETPSETPSETLLGSGGSVQEMKVLTVVIHCLWRFFLRKTRCFRGPAVVFYCRRSVLLHQPVANYYDRSIFSMTGSFGSGYLNISAPTACGFAIWGVPRKAREHLNAARQKIARDNFCRPVAAQLPSPRGQF